MRPFLLLLHHAHGSKASRLRLDKLLLLLRLLLQLRRRPWQLRRSHCLAARQAELIKGLHLLLVEQSSLLRIRRHGKGRRSGKDRMRSGMDRWRDIKSRWCDWPLLHHRRRHRRRRCIRRCQHCRRRLWRRRHHRLLIVPR